MGKLLIVNGSSRAPRSNSKKYAEIFTRIWPQKADSYSVIMEKQETICSQIGQYEHILFVFPLYTDAIPAILIPFLKCLEKAPFSPNTKIHLIINCGFLEPEQNDVAVSMLDCFCEKHRLTVGMKLRIATGEAILSTPFSVLVKRKIKKFVKGILNDRRETLTAVMPLSKNMFLKASSKYWINYGKKFDTDEAKMRCLKIEDR